VVAWHKQLSTYIALDAKKFHHRKKFMTVSGWPYLFAFLTTILLSKIAQRIQVAKEGTYLLTDVFEVLGGGHMGNLFVRMYEVPQVHVHKGVETTYIGWGLRSHDREGRHYGMVWARA
jgi:predicted phosphatase